VVVVGVAVVVGVVVAVVVGFAVGAGVGVGVAVAVAVAVGVGVGVKIMQVGTYHTDRTLWDMRPAIPQHSWHVTILTSEGVFFSPEYDPFDQDAAFDAAVEWVEKYGAAATVSRIRYSEEGHPVGVWDVTMTFYTSRGLDPDRASLDSQCDTEYDEWKERAFA
jgi:hypothetical protein